MGLPQWLTISQTAEYCGVDRTKVYNKVLPNLEVRRIGVRGGVMPFGRLIRIERGSLLPSIVVFFRLGRRSWRTPAP
jgi:hypothetical protein